MLYCLVLRKIGKKYNISNIVKLLDINEIRKKESRFLF